jgi:hypothetical protein
MTTANHIIAGRRLKDRFGVAPLANCLLRPVEAQVFADAHVAANPDDAVTKRFDDVADGFWYITLDAARFWLASMSPDTRDAVLRTEAVMGWFVADDEDDDTQDPDGDFCSTPGSSGYDDLEQIWQDLEHCSRAGLLMLHVPAAIK